MTSTIKVDNIQDQDGNNIINENSNTITIGASGDTVTLASGASQSGFGRSGSVDWQTTPKTSTFTAADGEGYFVNSGSALTMNLPAGSAGAIVSIADYARNFATYNFTVSPNGSEKIGGVAEDAVLKVNGQAATFVYVDSTKGWVNVQNAEDTETGVPPFICASGGTITECGDFKIHTFTGPGTFTVNRVATQPPAPAYNTVSYMVVAGGGGGGGTSTTTHVGAGGGAGGFREGKNAPIDSYTASPLNAPAGLVVTAQGYPITVGAGGTNPSAPQSGTNGNPSIFSTITSAGGGGGGSLGHPSQPACRSGKPGGSGGGGSSQVAGAGGSGNTPPVSPAQGQDGAQGVDSPPDLRGGGGGGATAAGTQGSPTAVTGRGGAGATTHITGSPVGYAGGGGGGATSAAGPGTSQSSPCGSGAAGGPSCGPSAPGGAATANKGGGGGGAGGAPSGPGCKFGGAGGSGVVVIRYKFQ